MSDILIAVLIVLLTLKVIIIAVRLFFCIVDRRARNAPDDSLDTADDNPSTQVDDIPPYIIRMANYGNERERRMQSNGFNISTHNENNRQSNEANITSPLPPSYIDVADLPPSYEHYQQQLRVGSNIIS